MVPVLIPYGTGYTIPIWYGNYSSTSKVKKLQGPPSSPGRGSVAVEDSRGVCCGGHDRCLGPGQFASARICTWGIRYAGIFHGPRDDES